MVIFRKKNIFENIYALKKYSNPCFFHKELSISINAVYKKLRSVLAMSNASWEKRVNTMNFLIFTSPLFHAKINVKDEKNYENQTITFPQNSLKDILPGVSVAYLFYAWSFYGTSPPSRSPI